MTTALWSATVYAIDLEVPQIGLTEVPIEIVVTGVPEGELVTVNGVRILLEDGTWGLVRASSNKPELVIVVESPVSEANMRAIFANIDTLITQQYPEVGPYNQKI